MPFSGNDVQEVISQINSSVTELSREISAMQADMAHITNTVDKIDTMMRDYLPGKIAVLTTTTTDIEKRVAVIEDREYKDLRRAIEVSEKGRENLDNKIWSLFLAAAPGVLAIAFQMWAFFMRVKDSP